MAAVSSSVATPVTRSTSSCASSTTTTSCSGSTGKLSSASMASSAWLVTTTSDSAARARASSAKHSAPNGHLAAPRHSRAVTLTWRQARSETPGSTSSRSPVPVPSAHVPQPHDVLAQRRRRRRVEERVLAVVRHAAVDAVAAQVVGAALEDRVGRAAPEQRLDGVDQRGQVPVDDLVLQGDRGRRDHDGLAVQQRRHQVGQRLPGAGAGLDEQVAALAHRLGDGLGHLRPGRAARSRRPRRPRPRAARAAGTCVLVGGLGRLGGHRPRLAGPDRPPGGCAHRWAVGRSAMPPDRDERRLTATNSARPGGNDHARVIISAPRPARAGRRHTARARRPAPGCTRARTRVPSAPCSCVERSPSSCTRETRSPRS